MGKLKVVELVIAAASTLFDAAKAAIKFIACIGKLRKSKNNKECFC